MNLFIIIFVIFAIKGGLIGKSVGKKIDSSFSPTINFICGVAGFSILCLIVGFIIWSYTQSLSRYDALKYGNVLTIAFLVFSLGSGIAGSYIAPRLVNKLFKKN